MDTKLIKLELRSGLVFGVFIIGLHLLFTALTGRKNSMEVWGSLVVFFIIINCYGSLVNGENYMYKVLPLTSKKLYMNFIYGTLLIILLIGGAGYLGNIYPFGNGPYNLFITIRNIYLMLIVFGICLTILNIMYLATKYIDKKSKKNYSKIFRIAFIIGILFGNKIPITRKLSQLVGGYIYGIYSSFNYGHIVSSDDMKIINFSDYRPEKLGEIVEKTFL